MKAQLVIFGCLLTLVYLFAELPAPAPTVAKPPKPLMSRSRKWAIYAGVWVAFGLLEWFNH